MFFLRTLSILRPCEKMHSAFQGTKASVVESDVEYQENHWMDVNLLQIKAISF